MQIPLYIYPTPTDRAFVFQLYGVALFSILFFAMLILYCLTKIQGHLKVIRSLMVTALQTDSSEARRVAASIHNANDES